MTKRLQRRYKPTSGRTFESTRASTKGMDAKTRINARAARLAVDYGTWGLSGRDVISQEQRERNMERIKRAARNDAERLKQRQSYQNAERLRIKKISNAVRVQNGMKPLSLSNG